MIVNEQVAIDHGLKIDEYLSGEDGSIFFENLVNNLK